MGRECQWEGLQQPCLPREAPAWSLQHRHACDLPIKKLCRQGGHVSLVGHCDVLPLCHWPHAEPIGGCISKVATHLS